MIEHFKNIQTRLLSELNFEHRRFLYEKVDFNNRLAGIIGPRGVGKTTLLLQYIKENADRAKQSMYFSADHVFFSHQSLYETVIEFYERANIRHFFIDEIHKYANWNQELKNLYDAFPDMHIIFSGSSSLDIVKGSYDLSRRAIIYYMPGLSFREYLNFTLNTQFHPVSYEQILTKSHELEDLPGEIHSLRSYFEQYQKRGYYPFSFETGSGFEDRLRRVIEKTIHEDIANYYNFKTENLHIFKRILTYLASISPGKVNAHALAKHLKINDRTASHYLQILNETKLTHTVYAAEGGNVSLRKPEKVFLHNTNLLYVLDGSFGKDINIGTQRELSFVQYLADSQHDVYFGKQAHFQVRNTLFEIGGPNKTRKQIKDIENAYLVKDDMLCIGQKEIPLWQFGFLY